MFGRLRRLLGRGLERLAFFGGVLEARSVGVCLGFGLLRIVVDVAVLRLRGGLVVLLRQYFAVLQWLNSGVEVILMPFLLDDFLLASLMLFGDLRVFDGRSDFLGDICVLVDR